MAYWDMNRSETMWNTVPASPGNPGKFATWKKRHTPTYPTVRSTALPKSTTPRPSGGTSGYSATGVGSGVGSSSTPKTSSTTNWTQTKTPIGGLNFNDIGNDLKGLQQQYAGLKFSYNPQQFSYADWAGRAPWEANATKRAQNEFDSQRPIWEEGRSQELRNRDNALANMNAQEGIDTRKIQSQGQQDIGRLQNMAANAGMSAGQGAMENTYGVANNTSQMAADLISQYAEKKNQSNLDAQNALGGINAEQRAAQLGIYGRAQDLADTLSQQDYERYMGMRGQKFGEFQYGNDTARQAAMDAYESQLTGLAGQEGILGARAGLRQDARNYAFQDYWKNKDFGYTSWQDQLTRDQSMGINTRDYNTATSQWGTGRADELAKAKRDWDIQRALFKTQYGGYDIGEFRG
jgi:hypothetical protein